ncbi:MAG: HYR domain-containing protein, partial [Thermoanaerobaculia bacterium]|nr:HYR domain-containing protein [Thermoanaerobaculia bacterium]
MKRIRLSLLAVLFIFSIQCINAAVYYRLSYNGISQTYTLAIRSTVPYVGPMARITNSTQVSIVAPDPDAMGPMAFAVINLTNLTALQWGFSQINSPVENPAKDYLFFAPSNSGTYTPFDIPANTWIDLFSFQTSSPCNGPLYLLSNNADPLSSNGSINSGNNFKTLGGGNINLYAGNESNNVGCTCVTYKMTLDPDGQTYRVSFNSAAAFSGPFARITGSTQFTVVLPDPDGAGPAAAQITNLTSLTSLNITSSQLNNPAENPSKDYIFFAPVNSGYYTLFNIPANTDIELFTFRIDGGCIGEVYLYDNYADLLNSNIIVNADNNFRTLGGGNVNLYCDNAGEPLACAECQLTNITVLPEEVRCKGGNDGQATVIVADGTPVYSYVWPPEADNQTTQTALNLVAGTYTVTVTDGLGCTGTGSVTIAEPDALVATIEALVAVSCSNEPTGALKAHASGGTPPYQYLWSNGSILQTITSLAPGLYVVTVTDANNCTATNTETVVLPAIEFEADIDESDHVTCRGGADGTATASAHGGTPGYTYLWSNGQSTATATNLPAGVFTVTVTDSGGCTATASVTITEPALGFSVVISASTDALCTGVANGTAQALASNGSEPYTYSWSSQPPQNNAAAWNLPAGTYTVTATDNSGCTATASVQISEPAPLEASIDILNHPTCIGGVNGLASVNAGGGTAPYTYVWNTAPAQTAANAGALSAGTYTVTVTDQNGCTATAEATLSDPANDDNCACVTYKMVLDPDGQTYRVSFKSTKPYSGPWARITGSTQFTIVLPDPDGAGPGVAQITNLTNLTALEFAFSQLNHPAENPLKDYFFFAPANSGSYTLFDIPANTDIEVFTFKIEDGCNGILYLYDNVYDPLNTNIIVNADNNFRTLGGGNVNLYCGNEGGPLACPDCQLTNITIIGENVTCSGGNDGAVTAIAADGTGVYSYQWSANAGNQTTQTAINLVAGIYTVTVTDGVFCTGTATVTISQPELLSTSIPAHTDVSCFNGNDGTATVFASGGTSPYIYTWSSGSTDLTATGLGAGAHTVTVTDANNCTATAEIMLSEPALALTLDIETINADCAGGENGSAMATPSGGTGLYDFIWSSGLMENDMATSTANGLAAGGYTLSVTDDNGCSVVGVFEIADPTGVTLVVSSVTDESCHTANDGAATVIANGGAGPYDFSWSNGFAETGVVGPDAGSTALNLEAGTYQVTATDANGCSAIQTVVIDQPTALAVSEVSKTDETCLGNADGTAVIDVTGGTTPYTFAWGAGNTPDAAANSGLAAGNYTVTITDDNNCTSTIEINIAAGMALTINELANIGPVCPGADASDILLSAVPANPAIVYDWSGGTGAGLADGNSTGLNPAIPGFQAGLAQGVWTVTVTASLGVCSDMEEFEIEIDDTNGLHWVNCPADIMLNNDVDACGAHANWTPPTAIDDCTIPNNVIISGPTGGNPGAYYPVGVHTIAYEATDGNGNTITCQFMVIVKDMQSPNAVCNDLTVYLNAQGATSVVAAQIGSKSTDNCDATLSLSPASMEFTCADLGANNVVMTVTDGSQNASTCVATITVQDLIPPMMSCPDDITAACAADEQPVFTSLSEFMDGTGDVSDNCSVYEASFILENETDNGKNCPKTITRVYRVSDQSGNTATCSQILTVQDQVLPTLTAPAAITLDCGDINETTDPAAAVSNWLESATATDNCDTDPELTYNFDATSLNVCVGGTLIVTWTATDACGNTGTATSTITVVPDTEDPVVTAPAAITLDCGDINETTDPAAAVSNWLASATATDNCDTDPELSYNFDATSLDVCVGGTLIVTWTATDACGNTGTATSTITVVPDTEDPVVTAPAAITLDCGDINETTDPAAAVSNWLASATATDNCDTDPELSYNFDATSLDVCVGGTLIVTWTATDACGNTGTATS